MIDKKKVIELAQERIDELDNGCYLIDIKVDSSNHIRVELDNEHRGIAVEDCMSVSRNIEHNLDRDLEDFSLDVSSPGLTEPLKNWRQYKKQVGKEVKVKLIEGAPVSGEVITADENGFSIQSKTKKKN